MELTNSLANKAMSIAQEQDQQRRFQRQMAANDYGVDAQGNAVTRDQRAGWNDQLNNFRQNSGAGATSQDLYANLTNDTPYTPKYFDQQYTPQGDGRNNPMPNENIGLMEAYNRGMGALNGLSQRGMDAFKALGGRVNSMTDRPQAYALADGPVGRSGEFSGVGRQDTNGMAGGGIGAMGAYGDLGDDEDGYAW